MPNAAIYARFSCSKQREESIEDQVRVCTEAAERDGYHVVKVYADSAVSGKTDQRTQFRRMVADAERGNWSAVYVYKLDRFARNRFDAATNKARLKRCGVSLVSATEHINDGPDGILMEAVLEGMAEYYSAQLAENVKRGMDGNAMACRSNGAAIYGYRRGEDGRYVLVEDEAAIVRHIFGEYAAGKSTTAIRDGLAGHTTRRGCRWSVSSICNMLRNERYRGVYLYNGTRVEGGMPRIVDDETWAKVAERLGSHTRARSDSRKPFPLTGKLVDVDGNQYYGTTGTGKGGKTYRYYYSSITKRYIPADPLEDVVARAVELALDEGSREAIVRACMDAQDAEGESERIQVEAMRERLGQIKRAKAGLVDLAMKTGAASDEITSRLEDLAAEEADIETALAEVERSAPLLTPDHVRYWLERKCAERDAGALASALASKIVLEKDACAGTVMFAVMSQMVGIKHETPALPQLDGCSDLSQLVGRQGLSPNTLRIIPTSWGFGISFAA